MSIFELIVIVTGFVFLLFAMDLYERKKFNILHFFVFFVGTGGVVVFILRPDLLDRFGGFFGVARGADIVVYLSIIGLFYLYFELVNKTTKQRRIISDLNSQTALLHMFAGEMIPSAHKTCFLIRAYNEAPVIAGVLQDILAAGYHSIVICDDGSTDGTSDIIRGLQQDHPHITLITHPINRGPGAANKTLFARAKTHGRAAGYEWFVTYDADGQMQVSDMEQFVQARESGDYQVLLGSRFVEGGAVDNISSIRRVILWGSKFVTLLFNKIYVTDPTNGYKMIHTDAIQQICLEADGFVYASEFLEQLQIHGISRTEVPVKIRYTDYSIAKGQKSSNARKILQNLIYRALFYK